MCSRSLLFFLRTASFAFLVQLLCFPALLGKVHLLWLSFVAHAPGGHPLSLIPLPVFQFRWGRYRRALHTFGLQEANVDAYHTLNRMG